MATLALTQDQCSPRGVTRLDGARGKKQVWHPHVRTWALSEANLLYWRKYLLGLFGAPHSHSSPGELRHPRYAPAQDPSMLRPALLLEQAAYSPENVVADGQTF